MELPRTKSNAYNTYLIFNYLCCGINAKLLVNVFLISLLCVFTA